VYVPAGRPVNWYQPGLISFMLIEVQDSSSASQVSSFTFRILGLHIVRLMHYDSACT
jgi:hypothetical protein